MVSPRPIELVLGSNSPRRAEILRTLGLSFEVCVPDIAERALPEESPLSYVARIAHEKNAKVRELRGCAAADTVVLTADTTVIVDASILGKPNTTTDHAAMLQLLSGRTHQVATAVVLTRASGLFTETVVSEVSFRRMDAAEIARYVALPEGRDKAGGYAIQGLASGFVVALRGSYSSVVGLPAEAVIRGLRALGSAQDWPAAQGGD